MNQPSSSSARPAFRLGAVLALVLALLGSACTSTFDFDVRTPEPAPGTTSDVESIFVVFGKESEFKEKTAPDDILALVHPSRLKQYYGYAEFRLESDAKGARWTQLSADLKGVAVQFVDARNPPELRFHVDRGTFETYADLALAIVVRTASREYRLKSWPHSFLVGAQNPLRIEVKEGEIQSQGT